MIGFITLSMSTLFYLAPIAFMAWYLFGISPVAFYMIAMLFFGPCIFILTFFDNKKPAPPQWRADWQTALTKRVEEIEKEATKAKLTPEQKDAQYMPPELRQKLGL